jgi:hypothetical protein
MQCRKFLCLVPPGVEATSLALKYCRYVYDGGVSPKAVVDD